MFSTGLSLPPIFKQTTIKSNSSFFQVTTTPQTKSLQKSETAFSISSISCPENETLNECGRVCEVDCFSVFVREECTTCGSPLCACNQGYARNNGKCVYWGDCPIDGKNFFFKYSFLDVKY